MTSITVRIDSNLRDRLNALKTHPRESYNEVIGRLVDMAVDEEPLTDEAIRISNGRLRIFVPGESTPWMRSWRS
jgi:predicted transcriptional regulator